MAEPLDPTKYHVFSQKSKRIALIIFIFFVIFVLPFLTYSYYKLAINRPSQLDKEITFEIKEGDGLSVISKNLYQAGAVNSEFLFSLYVFANKLDRNIQAGVYTISAGTPITKLALQFQHGVNDITITFIEGWRVEEMARLASSKLNKIDYTEFVRKAAAYEGYLFPDTYYLEKDIREDALITALKNTFDAKTADLFTTDNLARVGLSKEQVVVLASIVEREESKESNRPLVAGILLNRIKQNMPLGADATTQYAIAPMRLCGQKVTQGICSTTMDDLAQFDWWPKDLTQAELDLDNAYNTRKNTGLPPAPISNPSISSINAVLNYTPTANLYYLHDSQGNIHVAETLDKHNANVAEYLR